jgi:hypothetical protein
MNSGHENVYYLACSEFFEFTKFITSFHEVKIVTFQFLPVWIFYYFVSLRLSCIWCLSFFFGLISLDFMWSADKGRANCNFCMFVGPSQCFIAWHVGEIFLLLFHSKVMYSTHNMFIIFEVLYTFSELGYCSLYSDWLWAGQPRSWSSSPGRARDFICPECPDRLWGPPDFLSNGYWRPFPGGKVAEVWSWPLISI